jgi:hypothetical protein
VFIGPEFVKIGYEAEDPAAVTIPVSGGFNGSMERYWNSMKPRGGNDTNNYMARNERMSS